MSIKAGGRIVSDGLLLHLDAANPRSYSGSGNTWYDLTANSRNATLTNSPSYSSSNSGYLTFAASSTQWATTPSTATISSFTIEAWVYFNSSPSTNKYPAILTQEFPGTNTRINYSLGFNGTYATGGWTGKLNGGFWDGAWRTTDGFIPTLNTWYHTAVTYDGSTVTQYSQGASHSTVSYSGTATSSGGLLRIARRWDDVDYIDARIPIIRLYNRALNSTEILQNYNVNKRRYGL